MAQVVADADDLPRAKVEDLADLLAELDAGHPGGQVEPRPGYARAGALTYA
jgi:hypothetical protein